MEWLQLVYRVPAEPSRKRTYIWRQLRGLGAVYLQDACCILPRTPGAERGLADIAAKVREFGGDATLSLLSPAEPGWDEQMEATFNRARDQEYQELLHTIERLEDELARETRKAKFTFAALEEVEDQHSTLERWLVRVQARDVFHAPLGSQVSAQLEQVRQSLERFAGEVHRQERAATAGSESNPPEADDR